MKELIWLWSALTFALVLTGPAHATTLVSPHVAVDSTDVLFCRIVNAGTQAIAVKIEVVNSGNAVIEEKEDTVQPGNTQVEVFSGGDLDAHCRFGGPFGKRAVRASIDITSGSRTIAVAKAE